MAGARELFTGRVQSISYFEASGTYKISCSNADKFLGFANLPIKELRSVEILHKHSPQNLSPLPPECSCNTCMDIC